ncbi:ATP-binding protein [Acinetobacter guillouiae]|uniref:ATP-binding protein n=1 Tax=Acinetobacter guillouiae TaxID=106649 RepID=A0A8X8GM69_ACIGI|nr:ATP-binding protein [Acinetobacter guillouiae]MCF0265468.1 ATP-binding protein [Acinetobacter guillouiae]
MSQKVKSIFIKNFFDSGNVYWDLKDVNVLVGKNGSGKSTILQLIKSTVRDEYDYEVLSRCAGVQVYFESQNKSLENIFFSPELLSEKYTNAYVEGNFSKLKYNILYNENPIKITGPVVNDQINDINNKIIKNEFDFFNGDTFKDTNGNINDEKLEKAFKVYFKESFKNDTVIKDINKLINTNKVKLNVEYISTINMTANSISNIQKSDGSFASFLDYEIIEEFNKILLSENSKEYTKKLIDSLNSMFKESNKNVFIKNNKLYFSIGNGKNIEYRSLSSGERQLIYIFIKVLNALENNALILMDEPEISLHLSWQEKLITEIRNLNNKSQIIIVTHSPAILMNGWMDSFVDIKNIIRI